MADNQIINAQGQTPLPHACTECKRRKQKCDRQWPCNQCTKRKVVDQCRFGHDEPSPGEVSQASTEGKRKLETGTGSSGDEEELEANEVLGAIGYSRGHILTKLDQEVSVLFPAFGRVVIHSWEDTDHQGPGPVSAGSQYERPSQASA